MDRDRPSLNIVKTAAEWTAADPYLARNDRGIESDTGNEKIGTGDLWSATSYKTPSTDTLGGKVSSTTVTAIVALTAAAYSALTPKVATTLYVITDASAGATGVYLGSTVIASKAV